MANKARERRKQMLGKRLEPVARTTMRVPYDTTTAKSGVVDFLDAADGKVLALTLHRDANDALILTYSSREPITVVQAGGLTSPPSP